MESKANSEYMKLYHRWLFEWHCENFYPFADYLTAGEMDYLNTCFSLAEDFVEVSDLGYDNFSYYSYSHRVDKNHVNSSRLAFGTVAHPKECFQAALPVFEERNISIETLFPQYLEHKFYGLGWDILEDHFKIYWRIPEMRKVVSPFKELFTQGSTNASHEGLIAIILKGGQIFERKAYLYPGERRVEMFASNRGLVEQYDVEESISWSKKINNIGREIIQKYQDIEEDLDTISIIDKDHYTLYFP